MVHGFMSSHWAAEVQPPLPELLLEVLELPVVAVWPVPVVPLPEVLDPPVPIDASNMLKFCVQARGKSTVVPRERVEKARIVARRTSTSVA
jgi:hypothetical protein